MEVRTFFGTLLIMYQTTPQSTLIVVLLFLQLQFVCTLNVYN